MHFQFHRRGTYAPDDAFAPRAQPPIGGRTEGLKQRVRREPFLRFRRTAGDVGRLPPPVLGLDSGTLMQTGILVALLSSIVLTAAPGCGDQRAGNDAGAGGDDGGMDGGVDAGDGGGDGGVDGDAGPICGGLSIGWCGDPNLTCQCCPIGGPAQRCLCSTPCLDDSECTDASRPVCNKPESNGVKGFCAPADFSCCWLCV